MSVVGSDYDKLKQYNMAEIYDPTPRLGAKTSNDVAAKVEDKAEMPPPDVAAKGSGLKDDVIATEKSQDKTSLDPLEAADGAHLISS